MLQLVTPTPAPRSGQKSDRYSAPEVQAMQRAVTTLLTNWQLSDADAAVLLGGISAKTYRRWKEGDYGRVTRDLADRLSNLLGVHKALRLIFSDPAAGYRWMAAANTAFGGMSALDLLRQGGMEDLVRLRRYLDSVRGGW